ncbi:hypothetical protein ACOMHN_016369 [Nucella lapillus]
MVNFFLNRQYPKDLILRALEHTSAVTRSQALTPRVVCEHEDHTVAVLTYDPHNLGSAHFAEVFFGLLQENPELKDVFTKP